MADFTTHVWGNERIFMVDFGRAPSSNHPRKSRPDVDRIGYTDDANPGEHGPIVNCRLGQGRVRVRFYRTEISTNARLYAVPADRTRIRMKRPSDGKIPNTRSTTIHFEPRRTGRTSIEIRYHWPDGPIIGRLYVDIRRTRTINVRVHIVSINGSGPTSPFLSQNRSAGTAIATFHQNTIASAFRDANHILEPHGLLLNVREIVNSAWTNATFGGAAPTTTRIMRAMAFSPNRSRNRINVYLFDSSTLPAGINIGWNALGPTVAWAISTSRRWPNNNTGRVGSGVAFDTTANVSRMTLAHEFGHVFSLSRIITSGANVGRALQWHTIGDQAGAGGITYGNASRDDSVTRRRLMYPFSFLAGSTNVWRRNVGHGTTRGAMLINRRLARDITMEESNRAYQFASTRANIYSR